MASAKRVSSTAPPSKLRNALKDDVVQEPILKPKLLASTTTALKNLLGFSDTSSTGDLAKSKNLVDIKNKGSSDSLYNTSKSPNPSDLRRRTLQRPSENRPSETPESLTTETSESSLNSTDSLAGYRSKDGVSSSGYFRDHHDINDDWMPNSIADFSIYKQLGKGAFSKVYLCRRKADGKIFALKSMRKDLIVRLKQIQHVHDEKQLMSAAISPFITRFYYSLQDSVHLFIIMEYVGAG